MKRYLIRHAPRLLDPAASPFERGWQEADWAQIADFPWLQDGQPQATRAAMLFDDANLYIRFDCQDSHSFAAVTELNGPVHTDSCVEAFFTPWPAEPSGYFNLEINCCGTFKLGFGAGRPDRRHVSPTDAAKIMVHSSLPGLTKSESPADRQWQVVATVPFETLSTLSGRQVRPQADQSWGGNFYRCGGRIDAQYGCWNHVAADQPDYHRPECFGMLTFALAQSLRV